jgi:hypothetical protein
MNRTPPFYAVRDDAPALALPIPPPQHRQLPAGGGLPRRGAAGGGPGALCRGACYQGEAAQEEGRGREARNAESERGVGGKGKGGVE